MQNRLRLVISRMTGGDEAGSPLPGGRLEETITGLSRNGFDPLSARMGERRLGGVFHGVRHGQLPAQRGHELLIQVRLMRTESVMEMGNYQASDTSTGQFVNTP
jgi:hypothetical protein